MSSEEDQNQQQQLSAVEIADRKADLAFRVALLDRVYTKTRQKIKEKHGMIRHDDAMREVIEKEGKKILEEMNDEVADELAKDGYAAISYCIRSDKDEKTRKIGLEMLARIIQDMEDPSTPLT